jgi:hypothetical protein
MLIIFILLQKRKRTPGVLRGVTRTGGISGGGW